VSWSECQHAFSDVFVSIQERAARGAYDSLRERAANLRAARQKTTNVLREEAALYRVDRLGEIDADERIQRAGTQDQMELFRETATNWAARRAAVDTHYRSRVEEIDRFARVPEPPVPQALGVLLVFPPA
jgi:hypothetical protein